MVENLVIAAIAVAVVGAAAYAGRRASAKRGAGEVASPDTGAPPDKGNALFVSMFPELQPHFHPEKVVGYVSARRGRTPSRGGFTWKDAPGFGGPAVDISFAGDREECQLVDDEGRKLARFRYESLPGGGVLRLDAGKITVDLKDGRDPAVRYWHPEREFRWTRRGGWRFKTPVTDKPFVSDDRGTSWSDSSSPTDGMNATAAAAAFAGQGGTFDGGGASAGWDDPGRAGHESTGAGGGGFAAAVGGSAITTSDDSGRDSGGESSSDSDGDSGNDSGSDSGSDSESTSY